MLIDGDRFAIVDSDSIDSEMLEYLFSESRRRNVSIQEVYQEELSAKAELAKITPSNADLLRLAEFFPAPQAWYDE